MSKELCLDIVISYLDYQYSFNSLLNDTMYKPLRNRMTRVYRSDHQTESFVPKSPVLV